MAGELLKMETGINLLHVPYKGTVPAVTDVIAGNVSMALANTLVALPAVKSGRLRAIAITSAKRSAIVPDLPTIDEAGVKGYDNSSWMSMAVPAATPREIVTRLNNEMNAVLKMPDVQERVAGVGAVPVGGTPEQFSAYLKSELAKFERVVKAGKLK